MNTSCLRPIIALPLRLPLRLILLVVLASTFVSSAAAQAPPEQSTTGSELPRPGYEPSTGRNTLNYPPHQTANILHMRTYLRISDVNRREILARQLLTVQPVSQTQPLSILRVHIGTLQVFAASSTGRVVTFDRDPSNEELALTLDPPLPPGERTEISISYRVTDPPEGIVWNLERSEPGQPSAAALIYTQGQPESNRYWLPSHDFPNHRCTSELLITVPRAYTVVANGRLVSREQDTVEDLVTFHWALERPHPSYLVSFVIGRFDVVNIPNARVPLPVYTPLGQGQHVKRTFERTPQMLRLLENFAGEPFPWPQYAQIVVRNFPFGGMENTGATTLHEHVLLDQTALLDGDEDDLIAHELAHQWFGNLITCRSWEHIWLNEGFASYAESLWQQYRSQSIASNTRLAQLPGDEDAYFWSLWNQFSSVRAQDRPAAPAQVGMVSAAYHHADDVFSREANPYTKGSLFLHALRERLGNELFFEAIRAYVARHKDSSIETFQFRRVLEDVSGVSLQRMFDRGTIRSGSPTIELSTSYDQSSQVLTMRAKQVQPIDGYNPAFSEELPIWVFDASARSWRTFVLRMDGKESEARVVLASAPGPIALDPRLTLLAEFRLDQSVANHAWLAQSGPTLISRLHAVSALADCEESDAPVAAEALRDLVRDTGAFHGLRVSAATALGKLIQAHPTHAELLSDLIIVPERDARVRAAVFEACEIGLVPADPAVRSFATSALAKAFQQDKSYRARAAALSALVALAQPDEPAIRSAIVQALQTDSRGDVIRVAAIKALAKLAQPDDFQAVLQATIEGNSTAVRAAAATGLAAFYPAHVEATFQRLTELLTDSDIQTVQSSIHALVATGDPRSREVLEHARDAAIGRWWKAQFGDALRDMQPGTTQSPKNP